MTHKRNCNSRGYSKFKSSFF